MATVPRAPDLAAPDGTRPLASTTAYATAVGITVVAILSQYFVPELFPALAGFYDSLAAFLVVYGLPVVAFALLVGTRPLLRWASNLRTASLEGLRWYGVLSVVGIAVTFVLAIVYAAIDPAALKLLSRPNPVLEGARSNPWFWIAFSFVVGALEETIFRGWIFGYWLARKSPRVLTHAVWTSALFAGVHLYYGTTYGPAAPLVYPTLFLLGLSFALAVRASGGNLVVVALLHGANDASAFLELLSPGAGLAAHWGIVAVGVAVAIVLYLRAPPRSPTPASPWGTAGPPWGPTYPPFPAWTPPAEAPPPADPPVSLL